MRTLILMLVIVSLAGCGSTRAIVIDQNDPTWQTIQNSAGITSGYSYELDRKEDNLRVASFGYENADALTTIVRTFGFSQVEEDTTEVDSLLGIDTEDEYLGWYPFDSLAITERYATTASPANELVGRLWVDADSRVAVIAYPFPKWHLIR